ncbi:aspartate-semialdehyde dehydrogenase [Alicyclobacillus hesperidum URH17-3-68]|nr:aspartate-semialdehyde dehydrogenase [Alicyclobacillus hesperidum URH17-3-68]
MANSPIRWGLAREVPFMLDMPYAFNTADRIPLLCPQVAERA